MDADLVSDAEEEIRLGGAGIIAAIKDSGVEFIFRCPTS